MIFEPEYFTEQPEHVVVHDSVILEKDTKPKRIIEGGGLILGRKLDYAIPGGIVPALSADGSLHAAYPRCWRFLPIGRNTATRHFAGLLAMTISSVTE